MSLEAHNLTKIYGHQRAVDDLSFTVSKGEIVGFLGPNGAGKSTTMKICTSYLSPTSGKVSVCGVDVMEHPLEARQKIGYLPEHNPLYLDLYVAEYLSFVGKVHGLKGKKLKGRIDEIIALVGLTKERKKLIGALSKGYRQRVGLAQTLMHDPEVLILDEPTTGLDPNQIVEIRNVIKEVSQNKTVVFSSHIMQEVQALCDRVLIINGGRLVANEGTSQLKERVSGGVRIKLELNSTIDIEVLEGIEGVTKAHRAEGNVWVLDAASDVREALFHKIVSVGGLAILTLSKEQSSLEDVFKKLTMN